MSKPTSKPSAKHQLEASIDAWVQSNYSGSQMVTEYVIVTKTVDISDPSAPARYMYGWRKHADMDAVTNIVRRALRWLHDHS